MLLKGGIVAYSNVNYDDIVITVNGSYATLCGKSYVNIENKSGGKKNDLYIQQDMTLERRNGKWVFTRSQAKAYK